MAILVNGSGFKFVTGQIDADLFRGLTGGDGVFLQTGSNMAYSVPSANTVRILDGEFITNEGRRIQIKAGNYDDFAIPSGSQGVTTYYFIGYRFYIGTGEQEGYELCEQYVYTGSGASDDPTTGKLRDGAQEVIVALYRVKQVGITISEVKALRKTVKPLAYIDTLESALNTAAATAKSYTDAQHLHPGRTDVLTPVCFGHITNSKKTIEVMVPLKKTLGSDVTGISVYSLYATVRQTGPGYLYGAANNPKAIEPKHCTVYDTRGGLRLVWTESKAINDKAINNGLVSMDVQLRLTLT